MTITLTAASHETFTMYAEDADNWGGTPWVSVGNIAPTKEQRGNLSDLVQKGLIVIENYDADKFIRFTDAGKAYATANGIDTTYWA